MPADLKDAKLLSILRKSAESIKKHADEQQITLQSAHVRFLIRLAGEAGADDEEVAALVAGFQAADAEKLAKLPKGRNVPLTIGDFRLLLGLAEKSLRGQKLVETAPKEAAAPFDLSAVVRKHQNAARERQIAKGQKPALDDEDDLDEEEEFDQEGDSPPGAR